MNYTAIYQKEPKGGYTVYIPLLPGCVSYGKDLDEAKNMIEDAVKLYIESLKDHGEDIPNEDNTFYSKITINNNSSHRSSYA
ncbi:antitoxin HicB [Candidatus Roizmanbacteria bacterium RIFCSPHIGHO2_12_FULL_38_13]|nr:MAG: antitoxin HicB [Candidatus Roizmanbacteria bacterium RIFCSPHIGHO2_12_FULL_38_13]